MIRTTTAGTMNIAVISADRTKVRRRARGVLGTAAAGLSMARIVILQLVGVSITGDYPGSLAAANCFPNLPAELRASNVAGGQSGGASDRVFTGHVWRFREFGRADLKLWQTSPGLVVAFWARIAPAWAGAGRPLRPRSIGASNGSSDSSGTSTSTTTHDWSPGFRSGSSWRAPV
jgi:hypothetical protein